MGVVILGTAVDRVQIANQFSHNLPCATLLNATTFPLVSNIKNLGQAATSNFIHSTGR